MKESTTEFEHELSIRFSVPSKLYSSLYLTLSQATTTTNYSQLYTAPLKKQIKNIYNLLNYKQTDAQIRTIQTEYGFLTQQKQLIEEKIHKRIFKKNNLTLFLKIYERKSLEQKYILNKDDVQNYIQVIRDYIYCKNNKMRISIERHYRDYLDDNCMQMEYDCFNRYIFDCFIHIELEFDKNTDELDIVDFFVCQLHNNDIVCQLFQYMSIKNLNNVTDELINIKNLTLMHKYGYKNVKSLKTMKDTFFSKKLDGIRYNFCIFGKYLQIDMQTFIFENHQFGQVIIGHCEIMENGDIYIIDLYLVEENFHRTAKLYNISFSCVVQNYYLFSKKKCDKGIDQPKTQDEYYHMKRQKSKIKFLNPIDAIEYIMLLNKIWENELKICENIKLQKFYTNIKDIPVEKNMDKIDGYLCYTNDKIYKIKKSLTIDLIFKFDEMYRSIYKRMKNNNCDLKKLTINVNIQKTIKWFEFENKYPGKFNRFAVEFLYFSNNINFNKSYSDWRVCINLENFIEQISTMNSTFFVLLVEFKINLKKKLLTFTRLRNDKYSANSINVFENILKKM